MFSAIKSSIKSYLEEKTTKKLKFKAFLDIASVALFGLAFLSIPLCSFTPSIYVITWGLTFLFVIAAFLDLLFFYGFKLDIAFFSLLLFCVSAFISSALGKFNGFRYSPIVLTALTAFVYLFTKCSKLKKPMLYASYVACVIFMFVFIFKYRSELISLKFSRLGDLFGDENDIALFFGVGFAMSLYITLFIHKISARIIGGILTVLFLVSGFATGSRIFLFTCIGSIISLVFLFFGKKKIVFSIITLVGFAAIFIVILFLPPFENFRTRIWSFFALIIGQRSGIYIDYSTLYRLTMFKDGIVMFLRKPFFGWGCWGYATYSGINSGWSHNNISETLCNFGLIGATLFHLPLIMSFVSFTKKGNKRYYVLPFEIILFFTISMISVSLDSMKIYAYMIGIVYAWFSKNDNELIAIRNIFKNDVYQLDKKLTMNKIYKS